MLVFATVLCIVAPVASAAPVPAAPLPAAGAPPATLRLVWKDRFDVGEQAKLREWVVDTYAAVQSLVGPFPMEVRVYFHRRGDAREPVPWANTQRHRGQGVHLHVDPAYPLAAFRADWTAPHEFSHLILPYVGQDNAWFSEGFASYLQYPVMQSMGVLDADGAARRYRRNFERAAQGYEYPREPFVEAAPRLRLEGKYPVMYWGGAAYFQQVDVALQRTGTSLLGVLRAYLACCRRDRASLESLLAELDRLAETPTFTEHYDRFRSEPGFPGFRGDGLPVLGGR
jgi:hypothetical protein